MTMRRYVLGTVLIPSARQCRTLGDYPDSLHALATNTALCPRSPVLRRPPHALPKPGPPFCANLPFPP